MSSRTRILVGVFIVAGIVLFAAGLFLIGSRKQLFSHHYDIYTGFNKIDTITSGAKVRVSGMDAGEISAIAIPSSPSGKFRMKLHVDQKFRPIIRDDSMASIETEGMVGNKFVNIAKGSETSPECPAGCTLPSKEPFELSDLIQQGSGIASSAQQTIDDIRKRADQAIQRVTGLVGHVDNTVQASRGDIKAITSNGAQTVENANQIVRGIRQGQGAAGKLLVDSSVASNVSATIANAKTASTNVDKASQNIDTASQKADAVTTQVNQAVSDFLKGNRQNENTVAALKNTVQEADRAADNVQADTEALKHNFFLRGFFKRRGFYNLDTLTPAKYVSSGFVKKPRLRVWVPSAGVFESHDGNQQLSEQGRAILNQDMSGIVPYLPNNPIMVEGYASEGPPDQNYNWSRQRAQAVREYLQSQFHIDPKYIGAIPLGEHPPRGAGRDSWNGVCLVLLVSK